MDFKQLETPRRNSRGRLYHCLFDEPDGSGRKMLKIGRTLPADWQRPRTCHTSVDQRLHQHLKKGADPASFMTIEVSGDTNKVEARLIRIMRGRSDVYDGVIRFGEAVLASREQFWWTTRTMYALKYAKDVLAQLRALQGDWKSYDPTATARATRAERVAESVARQYELYGKKDIW